MVSVQLSQDTRVSCLPCYHLQPHCGSQHTNFMRTVPVNRILKQCPDNKKFLCFRSWFSIKRTNSSKILAIGTIIGKFKTYMQPINGVNPPEALIYLFLVPMSI